MERCKQQEPDGTNEEIAQYADGFFGVFFCLSLASIHTMFLLNSKCVFLLLILCVCDSQENLKQTRV